MDNKKDYGWQFAILNRIRFATDKINNSWNTYLRNKLWNDKAKNLRNHVVSQKGGKVVGRKLKRAIKDYCKKAFGRASYWPSIAYYTELRGEFLEGWLPLDYFNFKLLPKMNPKVFRDLSEEKALDSIIYDNKIVDPFIFRLNDNFYNKNKSLLSKQEVKDFFYRLDSEVIVKPNDGKGGEGIIFKDSNDLNLEELPAQTDLIFQKVVKQHEMLNKLYPHSINTFRVLTFIDDDGVIEVKFIIIRFGQGGSRVDNLSSGGRWVFVNPDGTVEPNAYDLWGINKGNKHPDTKVFYSDLVIPFVDKVANLCKGAHRRFPFARIVGWDVFIDEEGEPKLIEWNAEKPSFRAIEALFGPFFKEVIDY